MDARRQRAQDRRLMLLERLGDDRFLVAGLTNDYVVTKTDCTCPDFQRRGLCCKHIWFILERVLAAPPSPRVTKNHKRQRDDEPDCSICFEPLVRDLAGCDVCRHDFHEVCLRRWHRQGQGCPLCRS